MDVSLVLAGAARPGSRHVDAIMSRACSALTKNTLYGFQEHSKGDPWKRLGCYMLIG